MRQKIKKILSEKPCRLAVRAGQCIKSVRAETTRHFIKWGHFNSDSKVSHKVSASALTSILLLKVQGRYNAFLNCVIEHLTKETQPI